MNVEVVETALGAQACQRYQGCSLVVLLPDPVAG